MNKKVLVFLLVLVGLGGFVWWKTSAPQSAQDRLAQAMRIMEGLQSQAIPTALTADQLSLLEQVYQDSLERIPNIQTFRTTDKNKLIDTLKTSNFWGTGTNGLNTTGEKILSISLARTDDFNTYLTSWFTSDVGVVATKDQIKKLAQSINTLTNDIRLTTLYISWYEGIRGKVCTTNDPTNDPYVSGEVKLLYAPSPSLRDTCGDNEVKQFKCTNGLYEDDASHVEKTSCPNGCSNGVCLREAAPTLSFDMPSTGAINSPISVRVSANTGYSQPFFIIIAGDDDATFPTGALRIMSGEVVNNMVSRNFEIKFSKAGTMTVTIRPKEGAEVSKTIVIGGGSVAQCGNGIKEWDEQCDDGNTTNGDGCNSICQNEGVVALNSPVFDSSHSTDSIFVLGWMQEARYEFNLSTTKWKAYIREIELNIDWKNTITSLTLENINVVPIGDKVKITGLNIPVVTDGKQVNNVLCDLWISDSSACNKNILILPKYSNVGEGNISSWTTSNIAISSITYSESDSIGAPQKTFKTDVSGKVMTLVGSKPSLVTLQPINPGTSLSNTTRKLVNIVVSASSKGAVKINAIPLEISNSNANIKLDNLKVKDLAGDVIPWATIKIDGANSLINFPNGYEIPRNASVNLIIEAQVMGVTDSVSTIKIKLGNANKFLWQDLEWSNKNTFTWTQLTSYYGNNVITVGQIVLTPTSCGNGIKESSEECDDGNTNNADSCSNICKNNVTIASATCTGSRPINSVINAGAGSASRAWTYDGSPTGPYQNCTFRCQTGYLYTNGACTQAQITQPSCPAVLTPTCTNGTLTDNGVDANGCPKAKTCTLNTLTSTTLTTPVCPLYTTPTCTDGTLVDGGKDANGCPKALTCVKNTVTCPVYTAPAANFCTGGQVIDGGLDANGCQRPATCGPKLTTGAVTIDGAKDCWFGDATKKITIGDFIGYQSSANSGLKYLDEILLYGATAPTPTSTLTNILSYEDSLWTSADGSTPNTSTQLTNFFVFRTYSEGTRTWNIPTTGTKFYGCFARGDRPNTW